MDPGGDKRMFYTGTHTNYRFCLINCMCMRNAIRFNICKMFTFLSMILK